MRNAFAAWMARPGAPTRADFAKRIGMSASYVSQLCGDAAPWPSRDTMRKIEEETNGEVTARDFVWVNQYIGTGGRKRAA